MDFAKAANAIGGFESYKRHPAGAEVYDLPSNTNAEDCACEFGGALRVIACRNEAFDFRIVRSGSCRFPATNNFEADTKHAGIELDQELAVDDVITEQTNPGGLGSCRDPVWLAAIEPNYVAGKACGMEGRVGDGVIKVRRKELNIDATHVE